MSDEHPYTTPVGSDARCFIQWKGTDLCMDLNCPCGMNGHIDSDFVYYVRCPAAGPPTHPVRLRPMVTHPSATQAMAGEASDDELLQAIALVVEGHCPICRGPLHPHDGVGWCNDCGAGWSATRAPSDHELFHPGEPLLTRHWSV